jgi:hypothetical protein
MAAQSKSIANAKRLTPQHRGVSLLSVRKHFLRFFNWCKSGVKLVGISGEKTETH